MPVFFISADEIQDGRVRISGLLLSHLRASLRVRVGEKIRVSDEHRRRYLVEVTQIDRRALRGLILEEQAAPAPGNAKISLGQAILKGDGMDWAIQKACELGVASITPLVTRHTIVRPSPSRQESQQRRWQRIATEAAQQSEQWGVPRVLAPCDAKEFFKRPVEDALNLILTERYPGQSLAAMLLPHGSDSLIRLAVGPEGGWTQEELELAINGGFAPVSMGARILRAETAAIAALSILQSRLGELG